jgi:phenylalanyl-tRNA synthetase beta subunit
VKHFFGRTCANFFLFFFGLVVAQIDPAFFGQLGAADIVYNSRRIGVLGVVHPEVLKNYKINMPVGALELNIEEFL